MSHNLLNSRSNFTDWVIFCHMWLKRSSSSVLRIWNLLVYRWLLLQRTLVKKDHLQFQLRFNNCRREFTEEHSQLAECAAVVQCLMFALRKGGQHCTREIKSWPRAWISKTILNNHGLLSWNCNTELKWYNQWKTVIEYFFVSFFSKELL